MTASSLHMRRIPKFSATGLGIACCLVAVLIVNLVLFRVTQHIFQAPGYGSDPRFRLLIFGAVAVNVFAAGWLILFRWRYQWRHRFVMLLTLEALVSLLPFLLASAARIPEAAIRMSVFGAIYALFVYMHAAILVIYPLSNANADEHGGQGVKPLCAFVFAVSLLVYAAMTPWAKVAFPATADEPHYLLLAHSLAFDHDFDLANNYAHADYARYYPAKLDHHTVTNARGQEVPVHDVGLSLLLVSGYALAGRQGAMFEMNIFGAFLALGIFVLGMELKASPRAALAAWALFAFTSPLAVYSSQIYPELVAAGLILWAVVAHVRFMESRKWWHLCLTASALALLPWFSIRYWLLLLPMLAVMALHLLMAGEIPRPAIGRRLAAIFVPLLVSVGLLVAFDLYFYQTPIPNAGYVLFLRPKPSLFTAHILRGLAGLLFDRGFGLLTTAPVYLLGIAGSWILWRRRPWQGALVVLPVAAYTLLAALNRFWFGGWALPPRYMVSGVVLLAPVAALVLSRRTPRLLLGALAAWSFFIAMAYTAFPQTRYNYYWIARRSPVEIGFRGTGALSDFLAQTIGVHFGALFPSLLRASFVDYLLCLFWGLLAWGCLRRLLATALASRQEAETVEVAVGNSNLPSPRSIAAF
jgi:hypothetical protein